MIPCAQELLVGLTEAFTYFAGTTHDQPVDRWPREGLVLLAAASPYDASWSEPRRVHRDCHFAWEGNRYSVP